MAKAEVKKIVMDMVAENCYIIYKNGRGLIVDPGAGFEKIQKAVEELDVKIEAIILTHAHFDHIVSLEECRKYYNVPVYISKEEKDWLENPDFNGSNQFRLRVPVVAKPAEYEFEENKKYELAGMSFTVLPTPGHSPGGVSFDFGKFIIVGDALFRSGFGRYDLYGSDYYALKNSIGNVLFKLDGEKIVYPGHGDDTTIARERDLNLIRY
ncbi:metallo-beta-lactamase domain protein [Gemella bergeri ATCC 700627]|uniref:Metallo-beta-lactamase domain protein n=1 Tax=Gemella bergeri ATCC 700627 TaxID=1321820 RepID=U2S449_9BACL|nr:MBL fold metallo-hydrolase [Gemella bergeri]ERK60458.1 metallo-beta-lactamase domain protein [Gemella bergeri ATCC 700627]